MYFVTIMCRNDELRLTMSWLFTKRLCFLSHLQKIAKSFFVIPIFLTLKCLVALNELVNNQFISSFWHIIVTFVVQSNLVIRNVLIRNHFLWPIVNLLHKNKEHLTLRNNFTNFDCIKIQYSSIPFCTALCFHASNTTFWSSKANIPSNQGSIESLESRYASLTKCVNLNSML